MKSEIRPAGSWPLDDLCTYIIKRHHKYVYENLPLLNALSEKLIKEREDSTLNKISEVFKRMARDMMLHMLKEEKILFPFIEQMVEASKERIKIPTPFFVQ